RWSRAYRGRPALRRACAVSSARSRWPMPPVRSSPRSVAAPPTPRPSAWSVAAAAPCRRDRSRQERATTLETTVDPRHERGSIDGLRVALLVGSGDVPLAVFLPQLSDVVAA